MHNHGLYLTQNLNKHDESSERNLNTSSNCSRTL